MEAQLRPKESALCVGGDRLLSALVRIEGQTYSAIVDTGATVSYIPSERKIIRDASPKMLGVNVPSSLA